MQTIFVRTAVPSDRDAPIGITGAWHDEPIVLFRFGGRSGRSGVRDNVHAHGLRHARHCGTISHLFQAFHPLDGYGTQNKKLRSEDVVKATGLFALRSEARWTCRRNQDCGGIWRKGSRS